MAANKVSLGLVYRFCSSLSFSLIPDVGKLTLAVLAGLEPAISAVTGRRPLQLDCRTKLPVVTANHQMIPSIYSTNRILWTDPGMIRGLLRARQVC